MLRRLFIPLFILGAYGLTVLALHLGAFKFSGSIMEALWKRHKGEIDYRALEDQAINALAKARTEVGARPLEIDIGLRDWLRLEIENGLTDANDIVQRVREACPSYTRTAVMHVSRLTASALEEQIKQWEEGFDRNFTEVAAVAIPDMNKLGLGCVIVAGQKLPRFSPEALMEKPNGTFFSICAHCGSGHACQITRQTECVSIECPACHRIYAMLAADTHGHLRYVNEYLTGYAPPSHFPKNLPRKLEMLLIWREVSHTCHYKPDGNDDPTHTDDPFDSWQTALETQILQTGDCEDSSIMLTDWLLSRNFDARVAVGRYAERGGHAWVVTRLEGKQFLLESTNPEPDIMNDPLVFDVGSRYVPELLFDRDAIYVRRHPLDIFDGDYWSESKWLRIPGRHRIKDMPPLAIITLSRALSAIR